MARWYIIHAYSGFESKVKESILAEAERMGLSQLVEQVEVPTETVTEVKRGKKVQGEAARYFGAQKEAEAAPKHKVNVDYEIGDSVKVLDGPFASFNGVVEELDFEKNRVKVSVSIFGRATPVELDFEQVELSK